MPMSVQLSLYDGVAQGRHADQHFVMQRTTLGLQLAARQVFGLVYQRPPQGSCVEACRHAHSGRRPQSDAYASSSTPINAATALREEEQTMGSAGTAWSLAAVRRRARSPIATKRARACRALESH